MPNDHLHKPIVRDIHGRIMVVCEVCGLALDFRTLAELGFNTEDWAVEKYEAPDTGREQDG